VNVCLVGHGMMGEWHVNALASTVGVPYTVVGRRPEATAEFARRRGFDRWTVSLDEALADDAVDVVILATPSETHAESALLALENDRPVLVEIPLAMSLVEVERIVERAAARGLPLGVVHPLRARPELDELRLRVEGGSEQVQHVAGRLYFHRIENVGSTGYRRSWTDNLLWHHMAHVVDASLWVCGAPEVVVESVMSPVADLTGIPMDVAVLMHTELGQSLVCSGSYYSRERVFDLMVVTDRDSYRLDVFSATLVTAAGSRPVLPEEECCWRVTRDFIAAVDEGRPPLVPGASVIPAMRVLAKVQDAWDREHGPKQLPGRPTA
jgi:2-hydroxy-4-carboxymuconate semialdehyde hemiacetal dehydrogenase